MKTMSERIEAVRLVLSGLALPSEVIAGASRAAAEAFAPELFTTPPQAWLAPWEPLDEMGRAASQDIIQYDRDFDLPSEVALEVFRVMRRAHLSSPPILTERGP